MLDLDGFWMELGRFQKDGDMCPLNIILQSCPKAIVVLFPRRIFKILALHHIILKLNNMAVKFTYKDIKVSWLKPPFLTKKTQMLY